MPTSVAVVQKPPVLLDLEATMARALESVAEAAARKCNLVVFPEAYLPGYPTWIWRLRPGGDMGLSSDIHARLRANAVDIDAGRLKPLCKAARDHGVSIVCGMSEVDGRFSGTTLYNTVVVIGPDGSILNRHRKLMPTNPERMVWGQGDASGLRVVETPVGRIGALICWESYMPLSRYALYAQNLDIYIAPTWDCGEAWIASMRHIAREGGCWVISLATAIQGSDIPPAFPGRDQLFKPEDWLCDGDAVIVEPSGKLLVGPLHREKSALYGEIDVEKARRARRSLDVTGHYARPDLFKLEVRRDTLKPVDFT